MYDFSTHINIIDSNILYWYKNISLSYYMKLRNRKIDIFYYILFISLFLILIYGKLMLISKALSFRTISIGVMADASLLSLLSLLPKGKWRMLTVLLPAASCVFIIANILYYKNFGDLIPGSEYTLDNVFDPLIISATKNSFSYTMLIPVACIFLPVIYLIIYPKQIFTQKVSKSTVIVFLTSTIIFWGLTYIGSYRRIGIYTNESSFKQISDNLFTRQATDWIFYLDNHNFTGYLIRCAIGSSRIDLSPENISDIKKAFLSKSARHSGITPIPKDNLIMIVVESLPSKVLELDESKTLIPNLYKIINDTTTITLTNCKVLAGHGRSSDAQFMYNTGLLNLRTEALVSNYGVNNYPSLAKALNKKSIEVIGENKRLWNHAATSRSYGFSELIDNVATDTLDQDSIIFNIAANRINSIDRDFFLFISTLSMHDPYNTPNVSHTDIQFNHVDKRDMEYFQRLYHFDNALGRFIGELKQQHKFDDSLIIIIGDHEIRQSTVPIYLNDNRVPFIIINSDIPSSEIQNKNITQIDIFPTILDIMGIKYNYFGVKYTGIGTSIFIPNDVEKCPNDKDYDISELIIRGNI